MACDFSVAQDLAHVRPGRPAPRLRARRRQHRLPAALRRHRGARWRAARSASPGAPTRRCASACSRRSCPALKVDGAVRRPTRWSSPTAGSTSGPDRLRRDQDGRRRATQAKAMLGARQGRPVAPRRGGRRAGRSSSPTRCPAASPRPSRACASTSSSTGTATARRNRAWLGLNMMTEARAGFRAFHEGSKACREADFLLLRRRLAEGATWGDELIEEILAKAHGKALSHRSTTRDDHPVRSGQRRPRGGDRGIDARLTGRRQARVLDDASSREFVAAGAPRSRASDWRRATARRSPATCSARCAPSSSAPTPCGWVFAVGVDPAQAHHGIGSALLAEAGRRFPRRGRDHGAHHGAAQRRAGARVLPDRTASSAAPYVQLELDLAPAAKRR